MQDKYRNWLFGKNGALFQACAKGQLDLVKKLEGLGADINICSPTGFTILHRAAERGHKDVVLFLIEKGLDPKAKSNSDTTPLSLAEEHGHNEIADLLRNHVAKQ